MACAITFSIGPVLSFLEGCGQVAQVARMRFFQSTVSVAFTWTAMLTHHGLFAPAMVLLGQGFVAMHFAFLAADTAVAAVEDACGGTGNQLAARSVALSVEDCGELALRLLHLSAVYAGAVRISGAGRGWAHGTFDEHRYAIERNDAGVDDDESRAIREFDCEEGYFRNWTGCSFDRLRQSLSVIYRSRAGWFLRACCLRLISCRGAAAGSRSWPIFVLLLLTA